MAFLRESATDVSIGDRDAALVFSSAFLEHVPSVDRVIGEMARISASGALGVHVVDTTDHRHYSGRVDSPLAFLEQSPDEELVARCNRTRLHEYPPLFEKHGFEVLVDQVIRDYDLPEHEKARFSEPWRSSDRADLCPVVARFVVRYRGE